MILSGKDIQWYIERGKLKIEPVDKNQFQQNGVDLILEDIDSRSGTKIFHKNSFVLGTTKEYIEMPDDLMAFVQLRSTWARKGILVPPTVVDAGFKGEITLEIVSYIKQKAPLGERFAHLIFSKLTSPSEPYNGKYQGQRGITKAKDDGKN